MNDELEQTVLLDDAADTAALVTVILYDGSALSGTLRPHPTMPGVWKVMTGLRGRPVEFSVEDVRTVVFE